MKPEISMTVIEGDHTRNPSKANKTNLAAHEQHGKLIIYSGQTVNVTCRCDTPYQLAHIANLSLSFGGEFKSTLVHYSFSYLQMILTLIEISSLIELPSLLNTLFCNRQISFLGYYFFLLYRIVDNSLT